MPMIDERFTLIDERFTLIITNAIEQARKLDCDESTYRHNLLEWRAIIAEEVAKSRVRPKK